MKNDEVLVIKLKVNVTDEDYVKIGEALFNQMKHGLVLLPAYCDAVIVPKDIEVKMEKAGAGEGDL